MKKRNVWDNSFLVALLAILAMVGCSKSAQPPPADESQGDTVARTQDEEAQESNSLASTTNDPAAALKEFLEAIRRGDDKRATAMLSTQAREKTASLNRNVTPPASDTARFSIGKVQYVGEDGAKVESTWTDLDLDGKPRTDKAVWVLRRESEGWRVAGVAVEIFSGEPPLLLNFEDPEDMFRKQQWVRDEIRRRMEKEMAQEDELQAKTENSQDNPIRR